MGGKLFYETEKPYHDATAVFYILMKSLRRSRRRSSFGLYGWRTRLSKPLYKIYEIAEGEAAFTGIGSHGPITRASDIILGTLGPMQSGGMKPHDTLKVATILGATGLGLDKDLGGSRLAEKKSLLILDKIPWKHSRERFQTQLEIRNENGRLAWWQYWRRILPC